MSGKIGNVCTTSLQTDVSAPARLTFWEYGQLADTGVYLCTLDGRDYLLRRYAEDLAEEVLGFTLSPS